MSIASSERNDGSDSDDTMSSGSYEGFNADREYLKFSDDSGDEEQDPPPAAKKIRSIPFDVIVEVGEGEKLQEFKCCAYPLVSSI